MDMYWLNCFLLMVLAFIAGSYRKDRQWTERLASMAAAGRINGIRMTDTRPTPTEDITKH